MPCAKRDSLQQERQAAAQKFRASLRDLVVLVDTSATDSDFNLAHLRNTGRSRCLGSGASRTGTSPNGTWVLKFFEPVSSAWFQPMFQPVALSR
jgi:hypothetical protein